MNLLFAHGLKFLEDEHGRLYLRGYDNKYWDRYFKHFDRIFVIGRKIKTTTAETVGYQLFDRENLHFVEVPDIFKIRNMHNSYKELSTVLDDLFQKIDCVIARLPGSYSIKAIQMAEKFSKPYIIELVGCSWDALWNHSLKGKLIAPLFYMRNKRIVRNAPYVVYVTNQFLQNRYPTKGKSVSCSNVTLDKIDSDILEKRRVHILNMESRKKIIIGTIGAVNVKYKGHHFVIKALEELKKRGIDHFEYQLVGGGDQTRLKKIADEAGVLDQVTFLGSMKREQVFEWLDGVDIYIQPSLQEGLPRALIEAMSRGVPSIGSNAGGIPELLDPDFVFNKRKNQIGSICSFLTGLNVQSMIQQAIRNYNESINYRLDVINARRSAFIESFIQEKVIKK